MHLHIPKPPHGWREFVSEVCVIVIGISIAIGAEQTVEWAHHRGEVREMSAQLRAESLENRDGMVFNVASLRKSLGALDIQLSTLNGCKQPYSVARLQPVQRPLVLLATDSAWLGVRDSSLLPLMPKDLVDNYWKIDATGQQLIPMLQHAQLTFDEAEAAVEALRAGVADPKACPAAVQQLFRLKSAEQSLANHIEFYQAANEQVLRGERLGPSAVKSGRN